MSSTQVFHRGGPIGQVRRDSPNQSAERKLREEIANYISDPYGHACDTYRWGEGDLAGSAGPRTWQKDILQAIGTHLQNPTTRCTPLRIAVSSGHGIGKSALIAMVLKWALDTCEDCKAVLTANTAVQLSTKTVPEAHKWFRLSYNQHWWERKATSITVREKAHERLWRADFISWSENNPEAFAGLHNQGKRILAVYDEASGIPPIIWQTTEGALTDEGTEIIWLAFGNPTQTTGYFRECFGSQKHRWLTFQIDSRQVEGTNKAEIQKWLEDYGEDSDFFRVRCRGEFPRASSSQFISSDLVAAARHYQAEGFAALPKILAVDVARFGSDQTVLCLRQGRQAQILRKCRGQDTEKVAQFVIEAMEEHGPDATVVDGDGIGAGVIDHIRHRGFDRTHRLFEFHGGANAEEPTVYFNRRTEVWGVMKEWLKAGAQIPDDPELATDLTSPEYDIARGKRNSGSIFLEHKEDMKKRGLASPDSGDALAMTFAVKVAPPKRQSVQPVFISPGEAGLGWMG